MPKVRTRFAPSPTGDLHIGGLRTALYSFALAKHTDGYFDLRIEDTDQKREVPGSRERIEELLKLFGLDWDKKYVQSERLALYQEKAQKLVVSGHAFYCDCKSKNAKKEGYSKELRNPCRDKNLTSGAIKLKTPNDEKISFVDFVHDKKIDFDTNTVGDATLLKSDGYPTYHLAAAVDDHETHVTHALRGHDWLPSTPIHLLVYKFLGWEPPAIGHLTDILDPEGGKLSKRKGSVSVDAFLAEGFLPEALLNFVALLGWAPKDNRELFTLEELVKIFDKSGFQKANPVFDRNKLLWMNGEYIRKKGNPKLKAQIKKLFGDKYNDLLIDKALPLVKTRMKTLKEFDELCSFFLVTPEVDQKLLGKNYQKHLAAALAALKAGESLDKVPQKNNFKVGDFFMDLRIALTGQKITPPINESIEILGKEETISRLKHTI